MTTAVIYAQGRLEHAKAVAEDMLGRTPGARIVLVAGEGADWADETVPPGDLRAYLKEKEIFRPDMFVLAVTNEPRYLKPRELARALWLSIALRPRERRVILFAWSGRRTLGEGMAEAARVGALLALRPFYKVWLRLLHALCERVFPFINKKKRDALYDPARVKRALLLSLDLVGDFVWAAPAIASFKKSFPNVRVDLLVHPKLAGLAQTVSGVDRVLTYDAPWLGKIHHPEGGGGRRLGGNLHTRLRLLSGGYDLVVDFRGEPRHAPLSYLTGAPFRAGLRGKPVGVIRHEDTSYLLTHDIVPGAVHVMERSLGMAASLGFTAAPEGRWLDPGEAARRRIAGLLKDAGLDGRPVVGIQPGASRAGKMWDASGFAHVARELMRRDGVGVVLTGGPDERGLASSIAAEAPGCLNLAGMTTLPEYAALVSSCSAFICNDSSAISLASALKTPVVALMLTPPGLLGPYGVRSAVLQKRPGCWSPVGDLCFCPYGYRCLGDISPEEVVEAAEGLLA